LVGGGGELGEIEREGKEGRNQEVVLIFLLQSFIL
jgi:hypothetical protein